MEDRDPDWLKYLTKEVAGMTKRKIKRNALNRKEIRSEQKKAKTKQRKKKQYPEMEDRDSDWLKYLTKEIAGMKTTIKKRKTGRKRNKEREERKKKTKERKNERLI